ncbi:hypothetical protein EON80_07835 [bacterium]|nr:MAG: hypothetical protein EON80_07835 [bacterium]
MLSSRPAPPPASREGNILGFDSLPALLSFGALLALLIGAPTNLSGYWPADYSFWSQAFFLLIGAGVTLLLALSPDARPRFSNTAWLLIAFLLWNAIAISTSVYKHDSYLEVARVFGAFVTFFAVSALWSPERAIWIVGAWVLGLLGSDGSSVLEFIQTRAAGQSATFSNQNALANALAMTLPVALIFPILVRRRVPSPAIVALSALPLGIIGLGLLITSSKGGFLAALVALTVTGILICRAKAAVLGVAIRRHKAAFGAGALVFLVLFGLIAAKTVLPRLTAARGAQDNSTIFRTYVWRSTIDMARAKPLTGFGPGSFPHVYPRFAKVSYTRHAHQSWSQIAAENGIPATLLLFAAIACAFTAGWKRLKTQDWPLIAGMSGAIVALLVHGCFDSGYLTTSIVIMLAVALAILAYDDKPLQESNARLNPFWLGTTLLLALAGNQTQKAASGEDARFVASDFLQKGAPSVAATRMGEATSNDPGSARLWSTRGRWQELSGEDGEISLQTAAALQPTVANNWANLARRATKSGTPRQTEEYYAKALENNPLDTSLLLERAQYRLQSKNSQGYDDLEKIIDLWTQPLGLYPPIEQNVNLDFARATSLLAPKFLQSRDKARLQGLVTHALADCSRAQSFAEQNAEMRRQLGGELALDENADLGTLVTELQQLQTSLK